MAKQKYITCGIYKRGVTIFIGCYDEMLAWAKTEFTNPVYKDFLESMEEARAGDADCHYGEGSCIVRIPSFPKTPEEISYLDHELLHAVFYLMDYSGVTFIPGDPNEAYTYLKEYLMLHALTPDGYEDVPDTDKQSGTLKESSDEITSS